MLRGHVLPDEVRADRQLAMSPVDQDREADPAGPPQVHQRVHRRADRATRIEDVVDQHHRAAGDVERDPRLVDLRRLRGEADVVAIEADVQDADRDLRVLDLGDLTGQAEGEVVPAIGDPHEHQAVDPFPLDDLVGDPGERPSHVVGGEDPAHTGTPPRAGEEARKLCCIGWLPSRPHGTGLKGEVLSQDTPATAAEQRASAGRPRCPA